MINQYYLQSDNNEHQIVIQHEGLILKQIFKSNIENCDSTFDVGKRNKLKSREIRK